IKDSLSMEKEEEKMSFTNGEPEGVASVAPAQANQGTDPALVGVLPPVPVGNETPERPPGSDTAFSRAFSNIDLSSLPAEIKPEARLPYRVTLDNCLLLKVNRHIAGFDGTICSNPVRVMCGAQEHFRANYCDKGEARCYDLSLFSKNGYKVWKP